MALPTGMVTQQHARYHRVGAVWVNLITENLMLAWAMAAAAVVVDGLGPTIGCGTNEWRSTWIKHAGRSCQGYADGDRTGRTLVQSKIACSRNTACAAIECKAGRVSGCTLRANANLIVYSPEDCYVPRGIFG